MKRQVVAALVVVAAVAFGAVVSLMVTDTDMSSPVTVSAREPDFYADCQGLPDCVASKLVEKHAGDLAAAVAEYNQLASSGMESLAVGCHSAYHVIGRAAGAAASGPDEIWGALTAAPGGCSFGYTHGVVEGLFEGRDTKSATAEVAAVCAAHPEQSEVVGNCFHGAGHALLRSLKSPLLATEACDETLDRFAKQCVDGVMMEYAAFWKQYAAAGSMESFCAAVSSVWKPTCWGNIGPVWFSEKGGYDRAVYGRCEVAGEFVQNCVTNVALLGVFYALPADTPPATLLADCLTLEESWRLSCFKGVAVSLMSASEQNALVGVDVEAEIEAVVPAVYLVDVLNAPELCRELSSKEGLCFNHETG